MLTREDPVVSEVTQTLREWHSVWISLYLDNQLELFYKIGNTIEELFDLRGELVESLKHYNPSYDTSGKEQQIINLKTNIITRLDLGNRLLNLDLVTRDATFRVVDPIELSPIKLYQLHLEASSECSQVDKINILADSYNESVASATGSVISSASSSIVGSETCNHHILAPSCHLQMSLKNHQLVSVPAEDLIEAYFSIVDVSTGISNVHAWKHITERYLVQILNDNIISDVDSTIFSDLGNLNIRELCLHVQVYRVGRMHLMDGNKGSFNKQESSNNLPHNGLEGSTGSLTSSGKLASNGLSRSRNSTLSLFTSNAKYRRPFGTTLVPLKEYIRNTPNQNINVRIAASSESDFSQLTDLHAKRNLSIKVNQNLPYLHLELIIKPIYCTHELLPKHTTLTSYCITEKKDFPDIVMPGDFKNDLYFTLESAEFEKGGKSISKNIEASISLIDKSGLAIDKCISPASNCDNVSCHKSCIFYHSNSPRWYESIKINIPLAEFDSAHIRLEFRHCSTKDREKKFLGFSFLPLSDEDGTVIADGSHELYLYKCDSQLWEDESLNLSKYISLPYGPAARVETNNNSTRIISGSQNFAHSNRELIYVNTFLLSTKLTQNSNLLNLLKWRELIKRNNKDFEEALKKVLELKGEEIVKFLQDILDTLFDTFTLYSTSEDDYSALIFKVLVYIFSLLDEPKYQHFRPVLDTYASAHFSATLVYKGLLACIKKCLEYSSIVERHIPIQKCFKSIKYVIQFIVQSKILYSKATGELNDDLFLNDLRHLFKLFECMLSNSSPKMIPVQKAFLESFPGAIEQLSRVMCQRELANLVISLAGSVGFNLPPTLSKAKLIFMKETATSGLIKNQEVRLQITENFCRHLEYYIKHSRELHLSHEVLELLITRTHDYHWPTIYRLYQLSTKSNTNEDTTVSSIKRLATVGEISIFLKSSQLAGNQLDMAINGVYKELDPFIALMDSLLIQLDVLVRDLSTDRVLVQKYCTALLTIFKLMGNTSFEQFVRRRKIDYTKMCNLFRAFRAVYNRDWSTMQLTSYTIIEHAIDQIFRDSRSKIEARVLNRHQSSYIKLIVDFITLPTLQVETFSDKKRTNILSVFGDLRAKFGGQLVRYWSGLTRPNMVYDLTPTSIQPFLDASLLPNNELQHMLLPIFWDMIDAEDQYKSNSRQFERCFIDNLELFFNLDRGTREFVDNFESVFKDLIKRKEPQWESKGIKLVNSFTRLMRLLISYRQSIELLENKSKQMTCLVDLLNFYREQNRSDLYLKYLFKLSDMHLELGNHTEAAFTLKPYADEIKWGYKILPPLEDYRPEEQEWARKEALYQRVIEYFDQGKCWEETISICKELASIYENFLVDYEKVSRTLKRLAGFLDNILTEHRPEREYFRVEYIGLDFPDFVRDKEFIFRGGEYERLAAFIQRMKSEFPDAQVMSSKSKDSIKKDSSGQFMVISNVKPVPFLQDHFKSSQRNINDKIIQYYLNNRLDTFSYDVPMMKNRPQTPTKQEKSAELDVKNLWVGRFVLKVSKQLPNILPWSEVVSQDYIEISPINHAIETVSSMNLELSKLILSYKNEPNKQLSPLTMRLQGVIEAAVNGGPSVFVNAFLKPQNASANVDQHELESLVRLRDLIRQQFSILETGLALHSKLAPPEVMPLHARLVGRFNQLFAQNLGPLAVRMSQPPPESLGTTPQCLELYNSDNLIS